MYWDGMGPLMLGPGRSAERPKDGRLVAEIGFGNGEYLEFLARRSPDDIVVGFEVSQICATKAARRAQAAGLANVRIVHGDARAIMPRILGAANADAVYMNFPCPWPKNRHADRRVSSAAFARTLAACLRTGGIFALATDVEQYADETADVLEASGYFGTLGKIADPERDYVTKYERKWREMGRTTFSVEAVRNANGGEILSMDRFDNDTTPEEIEPQSAAQSWEDATRRLEALCGRETTIKDGKVVFKDLFTSKDTALLHVITVDEGFEQRFFINVTMGRRGARGKIEGIGHPYKTPAVRECIRQTAIGAGVIF